MMDALLYYDHYDPIPAPWYRCCGCASSDTPVAGCQCVCHDSRSEFGDEEYDPSIDGYFLVELDTGWPLGVRPVWVRIVRRDGADFVLESIGCCFSDGLLTEGQHEFRGDVLFSNRKRIGARWLEYLVNTTHAV